MLQYELCDMVVQWYSNTDGQCGTPKQKTSLQQKLMGSLWSTMIDETIYVPNKLYGKIGMQFVGCMPMEFWAGPVLQTLHLPGLPGQVKFHRILGQRKNVAFVRLPRRGTSDAPNIALFFTEATTTSSKREDQGMTSRGRKGDSLRIGIPIASCLYDNQFIIHSNTERVRGLRTVRVMLILKLAAQQQPFPATHFAPSGLSQQGHWTIPIAVTGNSLGETRLIQQLGPELTLSKCTSGIWRNECFPILRVGLRIYHD